MNDEHRDEVTTVNSLELPCHQDKKSVRGKFGVPQSDVDLVELFSRTVLIPSHNDELIFVLGYAVVESQDQFFRKKSLGGCRRAPN